MLIRIAGSSCFSSIILSEQKGVPNRVQVLRVGAFKHPKYGDFEITKKTLSDMVSNFDNRVRGIDLSFDYFHEAEEGVASAWVKRLFTEADGDELWAEVDWTPKAHKLLSEREIRYFSPDFAFKWDDPEKGITHENVLFGGGLTNRPFVKEMQAIVANENKGDDMTELEKAQKKITELEKQTVKLTEKVEATEEKLEASETKLQDAQAKLDEMTASGPEKIKELEAKIAALNAELSAEKEKLQNALSENDKAKEAAKLAEKERSFTVLLSEGKACAAQKDAFMKGDMDAFIKLSEPVNLRGSGASHSEMQLDDETKATLKLAEEKMEKDKSLSKGDAISMARRELRKK